MKFIGNLCVFVVILQSAIIGILFIKPDWIQAGYEIFAPQTVDQPAPASEAMPTAAMPRMDTKVFNTTAAPNPADQSIDSILKSLKSANIAFNTPNRMALNEREKIDLVLSLDKSTEELIEKLNTESPVRTAEIKVSKVMEANLIGDSQVFSIENTTKERQAISETQDTTWSWWVTPEKRGMHNLQVTLSAVFLVDGIEASRTVDVYNSGDIEVIINVPNFLTAFAKTHWWEFLAGILAPLLGAFFRVSSMFKSKS